MPKYTRYTLPSTERGPCCQMSQISMSKLLRSRYDMIPTNLRAKTSLSPQYGGRLSLGERKVRPPRKSSSNQKRKASQPSYPARDPRFVCVVHMKNPSRQELILSPLTHYAIIDDPYLRDPSAFIDIIAANR